MLLTTSLTDVPNLHTTMFRNRFFDLLADFVPMTLDMPSPVYNDYYDDVNT